MSPARVSRWRLDPPTDEDVANPDIIAWQFVSSFGHVAEMNSAQVRCMRSDEPQLLQVLFIAPGEPRAFAPGCGKMFYFRPFEDSEGEMVEAGPERRLEGRWRPVYVPLTEWC